MWVKLSEILVGTAGARYLSLGALSVAASVPRSLLR